MIPYMGLEAWLWKEGPDQVKVFPQIIGCMNYRCLVCAQNHARLQGDQIFQAEDSLRDLHVL